MGNQQSLSTESTELDDVVDFLNSVIYGNLNSPEKPEHNSLGSPHQMKYVTDSASAGTSMQDRVTSSAAAVRLNGKRNEVPAAACRWMKHYSSCHRILLVGEGDFSFSTCLASAFGFASNMVATSLDSHAFLVNNYANALSNLVELSMRKCSVMHEIDATKMATHPLLAGIKFDRIVFNFPFAGYFKQLPREAQIRLHRRLVSKFMENAKEMLSGNGEIHVTHKSNGFHREWMVEGVAFLHGLRLVEAVDFDKAEWRGYNTKRGFGGDDNFDCNPSITYKFRL